MHKSEVIARVAALEEQVKEQRKKYELEFDFLNNKDLQAKDRSVVWCFYIYLQLHVIFIKTTTLSYNTHTSLWLHTTVKSLVGNSRQTWVSLLSYSKIILYIVVLDLNLFLVLFEQEVDAQ